MRAIATSLSTNHHRIKGVFAKSFAYDSTNPCWILFIPILVTGADLEAAEEILIDCLKRWFRSGKTRSGCAYFGEDPNGRRYIGMALATTSQTGISIRGIAKTFASYIKDAPEGYIDAYAVTLNQLDKFMSYNSDLQQEHYVHIGFDDSAVEATHNCAKQRIDERRSNVNVYQPVPDPVNRYNFARMAKMLSMVHNCTLERYEGYKSGRYVRFTDYRIIDNATGEVKQDHIALHRIGDALQYDYRNFDNPDYQKGGTGDGSNR
jgi:hypothetical protein